ncbi:hypothetical protein HOY82DRAFT_616363 [Tuber indicum]|nr:hypothetical protein HOY82DRAFT_616363 [Tuber indicum]
MADKLDDPHHLVALMSYVSWRKTDGSPRRFDTSLHEPKFGIVDHHDTNIRTFPILDALAHISISQDRAQVVAIGLQLNHQANQIRLTVAENKDVADSLVPHLKNIWRKLQALSNEYAEQRLGDLGVHQVKPAESPDMPTKMGLSLKIEIFRGIYQYSLEKQMWRINKWWERLGQFLGELIRHRLGADLEGVERSLYHVVLGLSSAVRSIRRLHHGDPLTDQEWKEVYFQTMLANEDARLVLESKGGLGCESLGLELRGNRSRDPFPLRRALEKLTSLSRNIDTLFGFAHSPRFRPALQYRMIVFPIPKQTRTAQLPASAEEWKSFLKAACGEHDDDERGANAAKLLRRFGSEESVPVHCECGLIQYLQTKQENGWGNVPPFSCIGVSKLSCSSCRIWIEVFNEQDNGPKFYTRGSHGKWYWPWGMPTVEESFEKKMAGKILEEYRAYLVAEMKRRERGGSDSDGASLSGARNRLDPDDLERTRADAAAVEQEFGGTPMGFIEAEFGNPREP